MGFGFFEIDSLSFEGALRFLEDVGLLSCGGFFSAGDFFGVRFFALEGFSGAKSSRWVCLVALRVVTILICVCCYQDVSL